jgi:hypothetical protein
MATTTPNYGWSVPTSSDYVAQGAVAIETLGDSVDSTLYTALGGAYPGMRLVKKQTIGTAVSSVTVTGAFSATYDNYKIIVTGGTNSLTNSTLATTLGGSTSGYYYNIIYMNWNSGTGVTGLSGSNVSSWPYTAGLGGTNGWQMEIDVFAPFLATRTGLRGSYANLAPALSAGPIAGFIENTTSHTAFTLTPSSGTLTGGTIYVYGYGIS